MWSRQLSPRVAPFELPVERTKRGLRFRGNRGGALGGSAIALACAVLLATPAASAERAVAAPNSGNEFKLACSRSFEQSQRLRNSSQYLAAIDEVVKCADPKCGSALFDECTKIYDQLQTATPSVVFAARDDLGKELTSVVVTIDGRPSQDQLDGKPVRVDPGNHQFAFSSDGYEGTEQAILIRAGEQFRAINAVLPRSEGSRTAEPPPSQAPAGDALVHRRVPLASYVLGAVSGVGLGAFVGFRLAGSSRYDDLERECKPNCAPSTVDSVRQKYVISDVALGIGAAAAIAAVTVYLVSPRERRPVAALQVLPNEHGMSAALAARF